jgi:hypothetical protein
VSTSETGGAATARMASTAETGGVDPGDFLGLDALLTALYVVIDDFLPARRGPGRRPTLPDAEVICLAVAQVLLDCPSERRFLRMARRRLGHLFPVLLGQSGYNKRVRALAGQIAMVLSYLARSSPSWCDNLRLLDSTPVPCASSRETVKRSDFAGYASYGYCRSHSRYFWGFRLMLLCAPDGMPIAFDLFPANLPEREAAHGTGVESNSRRLSHQDGELRATTPSTSAICPASARMRLL